MAKDDYIKRVIQQGDEGSRLLAAICAPTPRTNGLVRILEEGMNGIAVLNVPKDHFAVVHSSGGNPRYRDATRHAASLVDRLVEQADYVGAIPVALADVIDANNGDKLLIESIGSAIANRADYHGVSIINGELAILGNRINPEVQANVSGTMLSLIPKSQSGRLMRREYTVSHSNDVIQIIGRNRVEYALFDPKGKYIYVNSDGVGTKLEFYERTKEYAKAVWDFFAMTWDDKVKLGAKTVVTASVCETKGTIPYDKIKERACSVAEELKSVSIMQREEVGQRIQSYRPSVPAFNLSGSVVSVIDEERFKNPLKPSPGEYLIAVRSPKPNPRSNGITDLRRILCEMLGNNYHNREEGKEYLEYAAQPSFIFAPYFEKLLAEGLATSFFHLSGGSFNGKLARPLRNNGLYIELEDIFKPDYRVENLVRHDNMPLELAYAKWPMGNEAFFSTPTPARAMLYARNLGLEANLVGQLKVTKDDKTGITLLGIKGSDGEDIYYSGKE